uniref:Major facilitator superfamily (MFS) profile domain-containing protein n=1 Tax=Timema poppense TaxID=170557 RepID=A0A7R9D942_TIMPO|nr:unnamed protein product [Timema poppensis]
MIQHNPTQLDGSDRLSQHQHVGQHPPTSWECVYIVTQLVGIVLVNMNGACILVVTVFHFGGVVREGELNHTPGDEMEREEEELTIPNIQAQGDHENEKNKVIPQIIATLISNIGSFVAGCVFGWTSPIIPKLKSKDSPLSVTMDDISWIGSLPSLGAMFGPFLGAYGSENIGRKLMMLLIAAPWTLSWVLVAAAPETITVFLGRFTQGLSFGAFFAVLPSYVGEISQVLFTSLFYVVFCCVFVPIVFVILFVFMPESPYFYFSKNRNDYAHKSLKWLRGHDDVNRELELIQDAVEEEMKNRGTYKDLFGNRVNLRALIIVAGLLIGQQFSGINAILFYAQSIFEKTNGSLSSTVPAITIGVVMLVGAFIVPIFVDRLGRKPLLLFSAGGMIIGHGLLGFSFLMDIMGKGDNLSWLPITSIVIYIITYTIAFGPIPWLMMSEMFAMNIRSKGAGVASCICWTLSFCITRAFFPLEALIGPHFTVWVLGLFCALSGLGVFFFVPETKGKTLHEIQLLLGAWQE